ncbi:MAG TPA: hypothetical protein VNA04_09195, partial [Thermoanaerobaculia bacterium]|nr:hypothetical protein [Thermoanaerobaculia bacterium]
EVFPTEKFQNATDGMVLLRVDTEDRKEGTAFSRSMGIGSLPTFLVLTPELLIAGVIPGYSPADAFVRKIQDVERDYSAFQKRLETERKSPRNYALRVAVAKEFILRHGFVEAEKRLHAILGDKAAPPAIREDATYHLAVAQAGQRKFDAATTTLEKLSELRKRAGSNEGSKPVVIAQFQVSGGEGSNQKIEITFPDVTTSFFHLLPQVRNSASIQ